MNHNVRKCNFEQVCLAKIRSKETLAFWLGKVYDQSTRVYKLIRVIAAPIYWEDHYLTLKVANGANFDLTKITGGSHLFQTDFPRRLL